MCRQESAKSERLLYIIALPNCTVKTLILAGTAVSAAALVALLVPTSAWAWGETQGCTPGYWKNHYDDAVLYGGAWTLRAAAAEVTGLDESQLSFIPADIGLVDAATGQASGVEQQFYRHLAAGILNIWSGQVDYLDPQTTLTDILLSAAADPSDLEDEKDALDDANNLGCPLN